MSKRKQLVVRLLGEPQEAAVLRESLSHLEWDCEEVVDLRRRHVVRALDDYLAGVLDAGAVEAWADAVEGRDDIGRESGFELLLNDAIHFLANPDTEGPLTSIEAQCWVAKLRE